MIPPPFWKFLLVCIQNLNTRGAWSPSSAPRFPDPWVYENQFGGIFHKIKNLGVVGYNELLGDGKVWKLMGKKHQICKWSRWIQFNLVNDLTRLFHYNLFAFCFLGTNLSGKIHRTNWLLVLPYLVYLKKAKVGSTFWMDFMEVQ